MRRLGRMIQQPNTTASLKARRIPIQAKDWSVPKRVKVRGKNQQSCRTDEVRASSTVWLLQREPNQGLRLPGTRPATSDPHPDFFVLAANAPHGRHRGSSSASTRARPASRRSGTRGLTPRSSRAPAACHTGPAGGTRYIFAIRARAPHRWCRLNSNVRPQQKSTACHRCPSKNY